MLPKWIYSLSWRGEFSLEALLTTYVAPLAPQLRATGDFFQKSVTLTCDKILLSLKLWLLLKSFSGLSSLCHVCNDELGLVLHSPGKLIQFPKLMWKRFRLVKTETFSSIMGFLIDPVSNTNVKVEAASLKRGTFFCIPIHLRCTFCPELSLYNFCHLW